MDDDVHQPRRSAPSVASLRWVNDVTGGTVVRVRRLAGATSSVLHEVVLASPREATTRVVLRRYVHPAWRDDGAELVGREAVALGAAASAPVPAPALVATDPDGDANGAPALLMTRCPGRPLLHGDDRWLDRLGGVYERMASWTLPPGSAAARLPAYEPWYPEHPAPPPWSAHPDRWEAAIELVTAGHPAAAAAHRPIHRDLHPANILVERGRCSAVVDWVNACIGPFAADLARGRANLAVLADLDAADRFLAATGPPGRDYDPWWDLSICIEFLPDPTAFAAMGALGGRCDIASARAALDALVARALASLR